jgi:hypothetical protein
VGWFCPGNRSTVHFTWLQFLCSRALFFRPLAEKNRGDWTPLELFVVGVQGWKAELRRRLMA